MQAKHYSIVLMRGSYKTFCIPLTMDHDGEDSASLSDEIEESTLENLKELYIDRENDESFIASNTDGDLEINFGFNASSKE